jgi:hypothetical protein
LLFLSYFRYGSHFFIVMPFFRLTHESRRALDALRQQRRRNTPIIKSTAEAAASLKKKGPGFPGGIMDVGDGSWSDFQFRVEWSKLCLFVAGPPSYDTLISLHSKWELFNSETDEIMHPIVAAAGGGASPTTSHAGLPHTSSPSASLSGGMDGANGGAHGGYIPAGGAFPGKGGAGRTHAFESLVSALRVEYSVLRQGDSRHLL